MTGQTSDTIGFGPLSDLPLGVLTLDAPVTGWIASGSWAGDFWITDRADAWSIQLEEDHTYKVTFEYTGAIDQFGNYNQMDIDVYIADPLDAFDGQRLILGGWGTGFTDPDVEFEFTADEDGLYLLTASEPFFGHPEDLPYRITITDVTDPPPPQQELPPLVVPDPGTPERALFQGDRIEPMEDDPDDDPYEITYFFAPPGTPLLRDKTANANWNSFEKAQAEKAMAEWAKVTGLTFTKVNSLDDANFVFGLTHFNRSGEAEFPSIEGGQIIMFDRRKDGWHEDGGNGLKKGGEGFNTLLHEIGHALGLDHLHSSVGQSEIWQGVVETSPGRYTTGDFGLNDGIFSVLSYNEGWATVGTSGSSRYGEAGTPMALDIAVVQRLYGANPSHMNGDSTYTLPSKNDSGTHYAAIFDTGGEDTIKNGSNKDAVIDLRDATLLAEEGGGGFVSYVKKIKGGFTIANGSQIENAIGGSEKDEITGNEQDNEIKGGAGKDIIDGRDGKDTITGGADRDKMKGGGDADTFNFDKVSHIGNSGKKGDAILDFEKGLDTVDFKDIDAKSGSGNDAFKFIGDARFSKKKGELKFANREIEGEDYTFVLGDVDGDRKKDFLLIFKGNYIFEDDDFIL